MLQQISITLMQSDLHVKQLRPLSYKHVHRTGILFNSTNLPFQLSVINSMVEQVIPHNFTDVFLLCVFVGGGGAPF